MVDLASYYNVLATNQNTLATTYKTSEHVSNSLVTKGYEVSSTC